MFVFGKSIETVQALWNCHVHLFLASAMVVLAFGPLMLSMRWNANREHAARVTRDDALPLT